MQPQHYGSAPWGTPQNFRPNMGGMLKKWLSAYKSSNLSETWHFRLVPKSMTLDDLEGSLCTPFKNVHLLELTNSNKLENIQRSAARWILSSYSYKTSVTHLLEQLQLESLEERRKVQRLAFMYKILNGQVAVPAASVDLILSSDLGAPMQINRN